MAKDMRPGQRNNLDALCRHFGIDNSRRTLHGALLDAELLADVYLAMTRGQDSLMIDMLAGAQITYEVDIVRRTKPLLVIMADGAEQAAHEQYLAGLAKGGACLWNTRMDGNTDDNIDGRDAG